MKCLFCHQNERIVRANDAFLEAFNVPPSKLFTYHMNNFQK